jgi:hypothetical protein
MANNNSNQSTTVDPAAGTSTSPPPITPEEVVRQFRALMDQIPVPQAASGHRPFRRRLSHVDPNFVGATINAVGVSPSAQSAIGQSDEDMRAEVDVIARWSAVADELQGMWRRVLAANDIRRQLIGLATLQAFRICEQLARDQDNDQLSSHVRQLQRMNKFGRTRRRKPDAPPEVAAAAKTP